jgi:deoxyribonucleoside regulator
MSKDKLTRVVKAAKMYYQLDYSQQTIAKELNISRPSVSRLLQEAKDRGLVQIKIVDPNKGVQELSEIVKKKFQLKECLIADTPVNEDRVIKAEIGRKCADYLHDIVKDGDIIGTTWGTTIFEIARHVQKKSVYNLKIAQLNGGVSYSETKTYAAEILNYLGEAFDTSPHFLPLPAVVDHLLVKQAIVSDRHIRHVLELGKRANIVLLTVGDRNESSALVKAGYFTEGDISVLKERNAVGDICSRMIDIDGNICHEELDARTIGVELEDLKHKENAVLVAGGLNKVEGIIGAIRGGYANVLITDKFVAEALLAKVT